MKAIHLNCSTHAQLANQYVHMWMEQTTTARTQTRWCHRLYIVITLPPPWPPNQASHSLTHWSGGLQCRDRPVHFQVYIAPSLSSALQQKADMWALPPLVGGALHCEQIADLLYSCSSFRLKRKYIIYERKRIFRSLMTQQWASTISSIYIL